jgi:hypothetical protein
VHVRKLQLRKEQKLQKYFHNRTQQATHILLLYFIWEGRVDYCFLQGSIIFENRAHPQGGKKRKKRKRRENSEELRQKGTIGVEN